MKTFRIIPPFIDIRCGGSYQKKICPSLLLLLSSTSSFLPTLFHYFLSRLSQKMFPPRERTWPYPTRVDPAGRCFFFEKKKQKQQEKNYKKIKKFKQPTLDEEKRGLSGRQWEANRSRVDIDWCSPRPRRTPDAQRAWEFSTRSDRSRGR